MYILNKLFLVNFWLWCQLPKKLKLLFMIEGIFPLAYIHQLPQLFEHFLVIKLLTKLYNVSLEVWTGEQAL